MLKYTKSRRYRFDDLLFKKLEKLKEFNIIESKFVRAAIEEKLEKELPILKTESEKFKYPF